MKKRLRVDAQVTSEDPRTGELVGLTIKDSDTGHPFIDRAIFKPVKGKGAWNPSLTGGIRPEQTENRLPFSFYQPTIQMILSRAGVLAGPHLERDLQFLQAQGVHIDPYLLAASLNADRTTRARQMAFA